MSTFDCRVAERLKREGHQLVRHYVPVITLASICEGCVDQEIDFLKIDTEGGEAEVIVGADFARFRPKVGIAEATEPDTQNPTWEDWDGLLVATGYICAYFDGLNRWYVRKEDSHLLIASRFHRISLMVLHRAALRAPASSKDFASKYDRSLTNLPNDLLAKTSWVV